MSAEILYICDHRACERCNGIEGCYTTNISHAVNFAKIHDVYYEKEPIMNDLETTVKNAVDIYKTDEIDNNMKKDAEVYNNMERKMTKKPLTEEQKANRRFWNFLEMVYKLAQISGLYIEGHIKVRDKKTGKVWE